MPLIQPSHLEQLAAQTVGRDRLGELVRKLIFCSVPDRILAVRFLAGDVNNFPGWDGWARLAPAGTDSMEHRSVWQISVEKSSVKKIRQDFRKSLTTSLPTGWTRATTTYVALTPRKLKNRDSLEIELQRVRGNDWYDVRVIDAIDLEHWIEQCPPVEAWAGEQFGIGAGRFGESLTQRWTRWAGATAPAISTELVLSGRDATAVKDGLKFENDQTLAVQTDSPEESVALVYALLTTLPQEAKERLLANALVIGNEAQASDYALLPVREGVRPLTILIPPAVSQANRLARARHNVVMAFGRKEPNARSVIIKRPLRSEFEAALIHTMNVTTAAAAEQARACGGSTSIWRVWNLLQTAGAGDQKPIWARDDGAASRIVPAALLRSWDEGCNGDCEVVAELAGETFAGYRDYLQQYGTCDDPLFDRVGTVLCVIAPAVAFTLLRRFITPTHLTNLERAVNTVFSQIEQDVMTMWDAPAGDSLQIVKKPTYSKWLRDGLAETLLGIAFLGDVLPSGFLAQPGDGQAFVDKLVRGIPGLKTDPRMLASLRDQLPYLAEAAPLPFVEALESLLQGDVTHIAPLFRERGVFGPTYHAGLLWALEGLAWSPDYLPRVALILAALAELDPGGNVTNRPHNTLREIFLAWHRGTSAPVSGRLDVLRLLHERHPNVAWRLLLSLMPNTHDSATPTHEPVWRDFGRSEMGELTNRSVAEAYRAYAELALEVARGDLGRQIDLLEVYPNFPPEYRRRIVEMLTDPSHAEASGGIRDKAWKTLHKLIAHHRAYSGAEWAMDRATLGDLEELARTFIPRDPVELHKWILDEQWPETGFDAGDFDGKQRDIDKRRSEAVSEILDHLGWEGVHRAIREYEHPQILAAVLAHLVDELTVLNALDVWAAEATPKHLSAIRAASWARSLVAEGSWRDRLVTHLNEREWPIDAMASAFLNFAVTPETFRCITLLGPEVERYYWEHCWLRLDGAPTEAKREVVESYIRYGRASDLIGSMSLGYEDLGGDLVLRIIDESINELNQNRFPTDRGMFGYHLRDAFKWLRKQAAIDSAAIGRREYPFLPLLAGVGRTDNDTLALHELLASDPGFFVQVICDVYKPAHRTQEQVADKSAESRAMAGWRLLGSWRFVPGRQGDTSIDEKALNDWVKTARQLSADMDRAEVADQHIGKVLYHAPPDSTDQSWPPRSVLHILDANESNQIGIGFSMECVNAMGVTSRALLDGGTIERAEERKWRDMAKALGSRWPRARALFARIADDWKRQAKWHDEDAEKLRMQWS